MYNIFVVLLKQKHYVTMFVYYIIVFLWYYEKYYNIVENTINIIFL